MENGKAQAKERENMKPLVWHVAKAAIEIADYTGFHEFDELEAIREILTRNFEQAIDEATADRDADIKKKT